MSVRASAGCERGQRCGRHRRRGGAHRAARAADRLGSGPGRRAPLRGLRARVRGRPRRPRLPRAAGSRRRRAPHARDWLGARLRARDPRLHGDGGAGSARPPARLPGDRRRCVARGDPGSRWASRRCGGFRAGRGSGRGPATPALARRRRCGARHGLRRPRLLPDRPATRRRNPRLLHRLPALDQPRGRRQAPLADHRSQRRRRAAALPLLRQRPSRVGQPGHRPRPALGLSCGCSSCRWWSSRSCCSWRPDGRCWEARQRG